MQINCRDVLKMDLRELKALPKEVRVMYDDGVEVATTGKKVLYNHFFWRVHKEYPATPLLSRHDVNHVLRGSSLTSDTHIELLGIIFKDACESCHLDRPEQKEHLQGLIYSITNDIYNEMTKVTEANISSIDIRDFAQIMKHPLIEETIKNTDTTSESIYESYAVIMKILKTDPSLAKNSLVRAVKSGIVNNNQVLQCIGFRGFISEVDGSILAHPVMGNYARGMSSLYDYVAESRSAAKALYFAESPLQNAEYFARRLALLCMTVEGIEYEDCGSDKYLIWRMEPPKVDNKGVTVYPGDTPFMVGKYYLDEETNTLKQIHAGDKHLAGKTLKIRTVLYCRTKNKHKVCEVCFGALAKNVSRFANLGHLAAATMTEKTTQSVLSTKHLLVSAISSMVVLTDVSRRFLTTNKDKNAYFIKSDMKGKVMSIVVDREEAPGLIDILSIDNIANINPIRVGAVTNVDLIINDNVTEMSLPISLEQGGKGAIFTMEFLSYLKQHGWETDSRNNFMLNLDKWDFNNPIFKLPDTEYSFSDHSKQLAKVIESSMKKITERSTPHSPVSTLQELFMLVNTKLNVNIAALEVIIYAIMLPGKDQYGLARNSPEPVMGVARLVIKNRSLSAAYGYQSQDETMVNPRSFFKEDRPDSIFDCMITPGEITHQVGHGMSL